jgi:endonuclease-8
MPEGDTIFRAARTLNTALAGQTVTRFESVLAPIAQLDRNEPIAGRVIERVAAAGKHLLVSFSGGLVLRTHMRMNGSWHIYRPGERWQMPARAMRIRIDTADWVAIAFNVYVAEFVPQEALQRHRPLARLGPDLLGDFDPARALALVRQQHHLPLHDVLLDQRVMAGIGNVYKSEILFLSGLHPDTPADAVDDSRWLAMMRLAQELLRANVAETSGQQIETYRGLRRTTGRMNPADRLWVYSRGGQPCRKCGTTIASRKDGDDARVTYWCPRCQASQTKN